MNILEIEKNIEKIKILLSQADYGKIDFGIELAISLDEPKIFEVLLDKCNVNGNLFNPRLNDWMKSLITNSGTLNDEPTGYYVWLSLLINNPSLDTIKIKELDLTNGYLKKLPINFSKLQNLQKLNLQLNKLEKFPDEVLKLKNLTHLHLGWNKIKIIPDKIYQLQNIQSLMLGNNLILENSKNLGNLKNLQHLDIGSNYLDEFPSCIFRLMNLLNINFINYNDSEYFHEEQISNSILNNNPNVHIIQPVHCISCGDDSGDYREEDTIERHDGFFCESHDEQWENPFYYCDCCYAYVAPRGYVSKDGNNSDMHDGYDSTRWFIDAFVDSPFTIIKDKNDTLEARQICELCRCNIPDGDMASYDEAEEFAEENLIEYWDN